MGNDSIVISRPIMSSKRLTELDYSQPHELRSLLGAAMTNGVIRDHWTSFTVVIKAPMAPIMTDVTPTHAEFRHIWSPFALLPTCSHRCRKQPDKVSWAWLCFTNRGPSNCKSVAPLTDGVAHVAACLTGTWVDRNITRRPYIRTRGT